MKQQFHIAHFTNTYHPVVSGVVRSISAFREALVELGHNVFIFAQDASDHVDAEPFIFRYPTLDLPLPGNFPLAIPFSSFITNVLPILKLDVIHSHHPFLVGQAAASYAASLALPLVFTYHTRYRDYSHYINFNQELVKDIIDRWLGDYMQQCHHLIVPSESIRQLLVDDYGITSQVTVIPTGIDLARFEAADGRAIRQACGWEDKQVLISVGRLALEKNWPTLLAAAAEVMSSRPDVRLCLVGDGPEALALQAYSSGLGIADRVKFTGAVPFAEIPHYLHAADLFCFASVTETQGLVILEALAAGLPVVAVTATGTDDVLKQSMAGLLTPNDSAALAQAIGQVLDDEALRQRLQAAARPTAAVFDIKKLAWRLLEVYAQAMENQAAGVRVTVDRQGRAFKLFDEEQWYRLLGREK